MRKIKQHIPNFCEGFESKIVEFNTLEELLAIPFVAEWAKDKRFYRFSISHREMGDVESPTLMAEFDEGKEWWVVGYLYDIKGLDLPEWQKGEE